MPHLRHESGSHRSPRVSSSHTLPEDVDVILEEHSDDLEGRLAASASVGGPVDHGRHSFNSEMARRLPGRSSWGSGGFGVGAGLGLSRNSGQGFAGGGGGDGQASGSRNKSIPSSRRPSHLHELHLQSSTTTSRPLSPHQLMLLMPFGSPIPSLTCTPLKRSSREKDKDLGDSSPPKSGPPTSPRGYARKRGSAPVLLPSHRRVPAMTTVDQHHPGSSPKSHLPHAPASPSTLRSQQNPTPSSSASFSEDEDEPAAQPAPTQLPPLAVYVPMTRSLSMPILTLRELDAMKDKEADLGIVRNEGWAWVSGGFQEVIRDGSYDSDNTHSSYSPSTSIPERSFLPLNPTERSSPPVFADPFRRPSATSQSHSRTSGGGVGPGVGSGGGGAQSTSNWTAFFDFSRRSSVDHFGMGGRRRSGEADSGGSGPSPLGPFDESGSPSGLVSAGPGGGSGVRMGSGVITGATSATNSGPSSTQSSRRPTLARYRTSPASFQHRGLEITLDPEELPISSTGRSGLNDGGGGGQREQIDLSDDFGRRLSIASSGSLLGIGGERRQETKSTMMTSGGGGGGVGKLGSPILGWVTGVHSTREKEKSAAPGSPPKRTSRQGSWASIAVSIEERPFGMQIPDDGPGGVRKRFDSVDGGKARVERSGIWGGDVSRRGITEGGSGRGSVGSERGWRVSPAGLPVDIGREDVGKEWYERRGSWAEL